MTKKTQLILSLFLIVFIISGCRNNGKITVNFTNQKNVCDEAGMPLDTFANYFPIEYFLDSIPSVYYKKKFYHIGAWFPKWQYAEKLGVNEKDLIDTIDVVPDTFYCEKKSFLLYQLKEPILNNHYLGRTIYRLIILRKLSKPPMVIRIDDYKDSITLAVKILNKYISRPFSIYMGGGIYQISPRIAKFDLNSKKEIIYNKKKYNEIKEKERKSQEEMDSIYNYPKYFVLKSIQFKIDKKEWNTLQQMLDTAKFWKTKPIIEMCKIYGSCIPIVSETGDWILEGHSENGYQIKVIRGPNFKNDKSDKYASKQLYYAKVFEYILSLAPVRCNNWIHRYPKHIPMDYWDY